MNSVHQYKLSIKAKVELESGIKDLKCTNTEATVDVKRNCFNNADLIFTEGTVNLSCDHFSGFGIIVSALETSRPAVIVERNEKDGTYAAMLTFHPSWDEMDEDLITTTTEIIYLV